MKRFWKAADIRSVADGWAIELDGKPVRTPARAPMVVPTETLARAIADEWNAASETVNPGEMPLTGLANAAIDRVAADRDAFAALLARYAEADLACYRADAPARLVERQARHWDALLAWGRRRYDVDFATTCGLTHVAQPKATVERLRHALSVLAPFQLAGLSPLVTTGGSLLAALALFEGALGESEAWDAVTVDERFQLDQWGADDEAEAALANRRRDFDVAARFLKLLET